jgi:hypothetical protein
MTRIVRSVGLVLTLATAGLCGSAFAWTVGGTAAAQSGGTTALPPGWELCVLEGVTAPATQANVADLDEWQAAEGGSTNNTAAFNPFNTQRTTDGTGAAIPGVADSANNFPAFPSWAAGCAATVATLYQPNMWVIIAALRAGNVTPAAAFLAVVDQSSWCAPSANGPPCYVNSILGTAGSLPTSVPASSALNVYGNVKTDLQSYQQAISAVTADQGVLTTRELALAASESQLSAARDQSGVASRALQGFAVSEYVSSGLYSSAPLVSSGGTQPLTRSTPQDSDGVVVQQYLGVAASNLVTRDDAATGAVKDDEQHRDDAVKAVGQASVTLTSDEAAENRSLVQLVKDVATLEHAGACTTVTITAPTPSGSSATGSTTTTTTAVPSTTTTTVPSTTTTTTVPPTTVPTTTVPSTIPLGSLAATTTTTTIPPTTTTVPPTTTTTTAPPAAAPASSATAPPAEAPGVGALQGCIAPFAPPSGT